MTPSFRNSVLWDMVVANVLTDANGRIIEEEGRGIVVNMGGLGMARSTEVRTGDLVNLAILDHVMNRKLDWPGTSTPLLPRLFCVDSRVPAIPLQLFPQVATLLDRVPASPATPEQIVSDPPLPTTLPLRALGFPQQPPATLPHSANSFLP